MDLTLTRHEMFVLWRLLEQVVRESFTPDDDDRGYGPSASIAKKDWDTDDREAVAEILRALTKGSK